MSLKPDKEWAKNYVIEQLDDLKNKISTINQVAVRFNLFSDMPTKVLDLSCTCDDLIGELEDSTSVADKKILEGQP